MTETKTDDAVWRDWLAAVSKPGPAAVLALTIVGTILRFFRLDHPPLLFDEAATYTRVTGSFEELLNILRYDGFAPLHYELYWLMSRFIRLTPFVMRIVPAVCGVMMIPAIYFLARQVTGRRVATLAAALTTFSAWQLVYARDAKMYMELWLACTLFVAALLWWLRTQTRIAWLAWVAAGCAMCGLHALGLCVVGVAIVIVLTHPPFSRRTFLLAAAGLLITCAGLAGHFAFFNRFSEKVSAENWRSAGLDWVGQRNRLLGPPMVLWDTGASWLLAYRSPRPPIDPPNRVIAPVVAVTSIAGLLALTAFFRWRKDLRDDDSDSAPLPAQGGRGMFWMFAWLLLPMICFAITPLITSRDVWNARYLGLVWPAGCVIASWVILRLPHRHLRGGAIALLIGANLVQFVLRVAVESGAPVDQIARDVTTAQKSQGAIATVVAVRNDNDAVSLGGGGGIFDFPGRYYLTIETGARLRPRQLRSEPFNKNFKLLTDVKLIPTTAQRAIVWTDGPDPKESVDPILKALGPDWRRASSREHAVRDFWCWRRMFRCRRSVYVRDTA